MDATVSNIGLFISDRLVLLVLVVRLVFDVTGVNAFVDDKRRTLVMNASCSKNELDCIMLYYVILN